MVAANSGRLAPTCARQWPITSSEVPYIGEESITAPPRLKNSRSTWTRTARASGSSPTLKVIHEPMPMTGTSSPLAGIFFASIGPRLPWAWAGRRSAASAASEPRKARRLTSARLGIVVHPDLSSTSQGSAERRPIERRAFSAADGRVSPPARGREKRGRRRIGVDLAAHFPTTCRQLIAAEQRRARACGAKDRPGAPETPKDPFAPKDRASLGRHGTRAHRGPVPTDAGPAPAQGSRLARARRLPRPARRLRPRRGADARPQGSDHPDRARPAVHRVRPDADRRDPRVPHGLRVRVVLPAGQQARRLRARLGLFGVDGRAGLAGAGW